MFSFIFSATVNTDAIIESHDEFGALNAPLDNELSSSSFNVQPTELSRYEEKWLASSRLLIDFPSTKLRDQSSQSLVTRICVLAFAYRYGMITVTWFAECTASDSTMKDAVAVQGDQKILKQGFKTILLFGRHHCCAACRSKSEKGYKWTGCQLRKFGPSCGTIRPLDRWGEQIV